MIIRSKTALALVFFSGLLFFSCNQDAIFSKMSVETEPKDPRVEGSPTNIVVSKAGGTSEAVYVASMGSSKIHCYDNKGWSAIQVPGSIGQLAATGDHLYAIFRSGNILYRTDGVKVTVPGDMLQSVYGANDRVFVGRGSEPSYSVVCYNDSLSSPPISLTGDSISGLLTGAVKVGNDYFISTTNGIYMIASNVVTGPLSGYFMGIIYIPQYVIAITNDGMLYSFKPSDFSNLSNVSTLSLSGTYSGAMCSWKQGVTDKLLLLGIGNSSPYGYREVSLDSDGKPSGGARTPGSDSVSTVESQARYEAALGKHAVYSILQVPGSSVIFASTTQDGLWSLRGDQWNAEE
jgi:hypothetical protein